MIKDEIDASRPILYRGANWWNTIGHAFVCDGYQGTNYFHFNWGWGGYADGYFYTNNLNPGGNNFNNSQGVIFNLHPEYHSNDLAIASITSPASGVNLSTTEPVTIDVYNNGTDSQSNFDVNFVFEGNTYTEIISTTIAPGETYSYTFATTVNLSAYGSYDFEANVLLTGDENNANDQQTLTVENYEPNIPPITNLIGTVDANHNLTLTWDEPIGPGEDFFEGFESGTLPTGWIAIDNDGDGHNWENSVESTQSMDAYEGVGCMASASYMNNIGALTPDNYLISPAIEIGTSSILSYWHDAQDASWADEHYYVKLSTTGTELGDFTETLWEGLTPGEWAEVTIDLSAYAGNTCYIAFHHTEVTDMFWMKIDNVSVLGTKTKSQYTPPVIAYTKKGMPFKTKDMSANTIDYKFINYSSESVKELQSYDVYKDGVFMQNVSSTSYSEANLNTGTYTYTVYAVYDEGVSVGISVDVSVIDSPEITQQPQSVNGCEGENLLLEVVGTNVDSYQWYKDSAMLSEETNSIISFSPALISNSGNYYCMLSNAGGSVNSDIANVNIVTLPEPSISGDLSICDGENTTLDAGPGYTTYLWQDGSETQTITVTEQGNYSVVVTNSLGCEGTDQVELSVSPVPNTPTITANGPVVFCDNESVVLAVESPQSGVSYHWSNGQFGTSITVTSSGDYSCYGQDGECLGDDSNTISVLVNPTPVVPVITADDTELCEGETCTISVSGPQTGVLYHWSNGETGNSITVTETGIYYCYGDNTDCQSENSNSVEVEVQALPIADFSSDVQGGGTPFEVMFSDLSTENPVSWAWDFGDGGNSTDQNPVYVYENSGVYSVSLQVETSYGCNDQITKEDYIDVVTGISNGIEGDQINLYPNPTNDKLFINAYGLYGKVDINIVNLYGIEIISETWDKNDLGKIKEIDLSTQYPGTYYLIIQTDNGKLIRKFIVL
jgi:hypothetical protein